MLFPLTTNPSSELELYTLLAKYSLKRSGKNGENGVLGLERENTWIFIEIS